MSAPNASSSASRYAKCPSVVICTRLRIRFAQSRMNSFAHPRSRPAYQIAHAKFRVRVERRPRSYIAPSDNFFLWASVLRLGADVLPNLIALQTAHLEIADAAVTVGGARI